MLVLGLTLVSVAFTLIQVNFIQQSVDAVLSRNTGMLLRVLILFIIVTIFRLLHIYVYGQIYNNVFINMENDLKNKFVSKIMKAKMKALDKENSGDLITKCNSDIPGALDFMKNSYSTFIANPIMAISAFVYLLWFNWQLSLFVFIPLPILAILLNIMSNRASKFYEKMQGLNSDYTEQIYDTIHGAETIKAYNMQPIQMKKIRETITRIMRKNNRYYISEAITLALIMAVTYVPTVIAFIFGAYMVTAGTIHVSLLFGYAQLIGTVCGPFIGLFGTMISIKNSYHSMKRIDTVMYLEEENANGGLLGITEDVAIKFANVGFGYEPSIPVFERLDFRIKKGQCVGIVGNSGAGKSTIVKLLCGLYEADSGKIEIYGNEMQGFDINHLRSYISYVSQQTYIMPATVHENIRLGNLDASHDEIERAIEWAGLKECVASLPDGMHTVLSEDGGNLSGGQRQRISLARAFLKKSLIYIFDEPTSSLDPDTEEYIVQKIDDVVRQNDVTSIIISHSLKALVNCDVIYFVRDGNILETGNLNDLIKKGNEFFGLFNETTGEVIHD